MIGSRIAQQAGVGLGRAVGDEHGLGERVVAVVREGEQHPAAPARQADLARAPPEDQHGGLALLAAHLELAPPDAEPQPPAERLETSLLGGEARREVRDRVAPGPAVGDLLLGEDAMEEALLPAPDHLAHPRDVDDVEPNPLDGHTAPICPRTTPASSSAMAQIRPWSAPSIMMRATGSVPEYLMRMRPALLISSSNVRTRSPKPGSESKGGLERTGTLTSTCGNFRMQLASAAKSSPVSRITDRSASAERMPSPAGAWSWKSRWPDCSPPRLASRRCISSLT